MGLQDDDVIAVEKAQKYEEDCSNGFVAIEGNKRMLEQEELVELFDTIIMVPKWEDGEEVSIVGCVIRNVWEKQFEAVETIKQEL